jgi:hypothetical protein
MEDDAEKKMLRLFEQLAMHITESGLDTDAVGAVLIKLAVLHAVNRLDRQEFLDHVGYAWNYEKFFHPESDEMH